MAGAIKKIEEYDRSGKKVRAHSRGGDGPQHRELVEKLSSLVESRNVRKKDAEEFRSWLTERLSSEGSGEGGGEAE